MLVKDIMTNSIVSLNSEDSVERAAKLMKQFDVGSIPVFSEEKLVGMITDRDIILRTVATSGNGNNQKICEVMTSNPVTGTPDMDVHDAAKIMSEQQTKN